MFGCWRIFEVVSSTGDYQGARSSSVCAVGGGSGSGGDSRAPTFKNVCGVRGFTYNRFGKRTIPIICDISSERNPPFRRN